MDDPNNLIMMLFYVLRENEQLRQVNRQLNEQTDQLSGDRLCVRIADVRIYRAFHVASRSLKKSLLFVRTRRVWLHITEFARGVEMCKALTILRHRRRRVLRDFAGLRFTHGGLSQALCRVAGKVRSDYDQLVRDNPIQCDKHKCIAYHLRAIAALKRLAGTDDLTYLNDWELFFKTAIILYKLRTCVSETEFADKRQRLERRCDELINQPRASPADLRIKHRLENYS